MSAKVLIVEDEILIGIEFEHALQERGYKVIGVAADYEAAVRLARQCPEIALVDVNLRDGPTGPLVARELADRAGASIVFVTANPNEVALPVAGAIGIVTKPADSELVTAAVDYALAVRAGERKVAPGGLAPIGFEASEEGSRSPAE